MSYLKTILNFLNSDRTWAIFLTAAYVFFFIFTCFIKGYNPLNLEMNELGSFWGGISAPPVLLFIIAQYTLQYDQNKKENIERKNFENERIRLAQPLFDFRNSYFSEIDDFPSGDCFDLLTFKVTNYLADATDVVIQVVSEDENINSKIGKIRKVFRGDEEVITIRFDEFKPSEFEIIVSFYDSLRLFKTKKYKCHKD